MPAEDTLDDLLLVVQVRAPPIRLPEIVVPLRSGVARLQGDGSRDGGADDRERTVGSDVDCAGLHGVLQAQLLRPGHVEDTAVGAADGLGAVRSCLGGDGSDSPGGREDEDSGEQARILWRIRRW
jgi:hypothetical protein